MLPIERKSVPVSVSAGPENEEADLPRTRTVSTAFFSIATGFWSGETRQKAWLLTIGVLAAILFTLAATIGVNRWNKFFFDALERKDGGAVLSGVLVIFGLALASAAGSVFLVEMRMRLQVRWRQWLTTYLVERWVSERRFYQLTLIADSTDNPEGRIAEDGRLAIEPLVEFLVGFTNAVLSAIAFVGVLWFVGGSLTIFGVTIPGFMVVGAVIYSTITSTVMVLLGRPLVRRVEHKNAGEAQLRFELTRVRESAENIAMIGGDEDEKERLSETFKELVLRWTGVIRQQARMTWVGNTVFVLAPIIPLLMGAPKYLSGGLSLGELMQIATAFTQVQYALNWLVDNAIRLAEWMASAQRVVELTDALDELEESIGEYGKDPTIVLGDSPDSNFYIKDLSIRQVNGTVMIDGTNLNVEAGEKILLKGESGTGKSTLIRAIAGLWPWGTGTILRPKDAIVTFMPQRPYIPLGTLRRALYYPFGEIDVSDKKIKQALDRCGLVRLFERLDEEDNWERILSGGEQQRLAFAKLLINPPDIIVMDESTSALDEISQGTMMELLRTDLKAATVLSVGHRPGLEAYHDREINLVRVKGGPAKTEYRKYPRVRSVISGIIKRPKRKRQAAK